jgi:glycosyltransferase involved in cell wall biosynthesis
VHQNKIELLHTHDLPMVALGSAAARRAGIPLVADLHENWPAALRTYGYVRRFPGRLLISPKRWERHERTVLPSVDRIVVVIEEARERLVALGIDREKIAVVRNTVDPDEFRSFGLEPDLLERFRGRFVLTYLGGFEIHRGLEMVVGAMPEIACQIPDSLLLLVGTGSNEPALREQSRRLGIADRVVFEGWQPFRRFPTYITASSVCLIPHVRSEHTDTTIPHKLFHYMLLSRPVLTTDCRPLRRIVEETGCGLVIPSGDRSALGAAVRQLTDPERRRAMGEAGERAVRQNYNWEVDAAVLRATYDGLFPSSMPRSRS